MTDLPKAYNAKDVESAIYKRWEDSGFFNPDNLTGKPYTIIMPPPNANAPSHIGHALGYTIQDILIRWKRMQGFKTLWLPGTDHAGFETQVVFEKKLEKESRSRFKMQRDEFYKEIWDYVQANKHISEKAIRRLGASCDWSRNIFTLDERIIKIVYETFEEMYRDGLVYRAGRICNWCLKHQTALSDLETKHEERTDPFYYLKYGPFTIGTARPETKFGDKYIVMHPDDKRYQQYKHGDQLKLEWINGPVEATIIKDEAVDMGFGTGVMTITPNHDATDFEIAERHNLDHEQIIDKRGKLLPIAGEFAGQSIDAARPAIIAKLKEKGLLEKIDEKYKHNVQLCYKCNRIIEPQVIPQWYIAMNKPLPDGRPSLKDMAIKAVKDKKVEIVTKRFEKIFMHWMENLRDWPISRQIWWGIPIPVWYCGNVEKTNIPKMGFHSDIVPELIRKEKRRTYRLRDHNLKVGDEFVFENSATKTLLGRGVITNISRTTAGKIELPDQIHSGKYKTTAELIKAFKRMHPEKTINNNTPVIIYDYEFDPLTHDCGQIIISKTKPKACPACKGSNLIQDSDTFDTWFSSGQWPYATLQAHSKKDFETFFPTQVMETAWDILFFWVARMIMFSYYKTGRSPFEKVLLHGLVRDKDRQKMSKSKGNVVDPLGVIDLYGADALRFALVFSTAAGNDIPLSEDKIKGMKHFANKLWNIARFVITNQSPLPNPPHQGEGNSKNISSPSRGEDKGGGENPKSQSTADKDILDKLDKLVKSVNNDLDTFRLHEAAQAIYDFTWHEFADKYVEASKNQLQNEKIAQNTQEILLYCLMTVLKLLHPFMPFVTEHIWSHLDDKNLLMIQSYPGSKK